MATAEELMAYEEYSDGSGAKHQTRKATGQQEWFITAKNKKTYCVKFDKNFVKKHLYTSSKKQDEIQKLAQQLYVADGSPKGKTWMDYREKAQAQKDEAKFGKQLGHRSKDEQAVCVTCGHPRDKHTTGSGAPTPCKVEKSPGVKCGCGHFVGQYEKKRTDENKPTINPLAGATTSKNTIIWLNKIPKSDFESTVSDAIIAKENELAKATKTWNTADGEHIDWNFGNSNLGCVLDAEFGKPMDQWVKKSGAKVSIKALPTTDLTKPIFEVFHCLGSI